MKLYKMFFHMLREREITPLRIYNFVLNLAYHTLNIRNVKGHPSILMIEPTNFCNLKCPICPTGNGALTAPQGFMSLENFKKIIDENGKYLLNLTLWNYGEPFLNKNIYEMMKYARERNIFVRISTNGHFFEKEENIKKLIDSDADYIIVSLDGASQETFLKYRAKGNFDVVIQNIKKIIEERNRQKKTKPFVEIQFMVMKHNEHEIEKMKELAKLLNVDNVKIKTINIELGLSKDMKKTIEQYLPKEEEYTRYKKSEAGLERKKMKNSCKRLWLSSVINWDGSVVPCCFDPNRKYEMGNVFENDFKSVWNSNRYIQLRKTVGINKKSIEMCKNCNGDLTGTDLE